MKPDDLICYCYRVSMRKLVNYARREKPARASLMSRCLDAGTGCGWCIPFLKKIQAEPERFSVTESSEEYAGRRQSYIKTAPKNEF